jgi:Transglutaminase-like superfamily
MSELTTADSLRLHGLHWLARAALRVRPPLQAKALVDRVARFLPSLEGVEDARAAVRGLYPSGSCLSRALTIAARLPGTEVVIGVHAWNSAQLSAHAWLRIDEESVDTSPGSNNELPTELARLPPRRV